MNIMFINKKIVFLLFLILPFSIFSQTKEINTLRKNIQAEKNDTSKVNYLNLLGKKLLGYNLDNALDTLNLSMRIAKDADFYKGLAKAYKIRGFVFYYKGLVDSSLENFEKGKKIYEENGFLEDAGRMANNIGIVKSKLGDLHGAVSSYLEAIEFLKQTNQYRPLISTYINASNTYRNIGNFQEALELDFNALKAFNLLKDINQKDSLNIGHIYKSIANIYTNQKSFKDAENYYSKALKIYEKYKSNNDIGDIYLNIGYLYGSKKDTIAEKNSYLKALPKYTRKDKIALADLNLSDSYNKIGKLDSTKFYLDKALELYSQLTDKRGIALVYASYGEYYSKLKEYNKAIKVSKIALDTAEKIGDIQIISSLSLGLYTFYKKIGDYKKALSMHELYLKMHDSIFNSNNEKKLTKISLTYEFEKQKEQTQLKYNEEIKRQKIIKNFTFAVLFFVIMALLAVFSAFRTKKKKNRELYKKNAEIMQQKEEITAQRDEIEAQLEQIEKQKEHIEKQSKEIEAQRDLAIKRGNELEQKNRDIESSIHYALRIQQAILPNLDIFKNYFTDSFVYYKPRDIVSGDFYWATEQNNKLIVAAADCTGHGVPGAFMSMLGVSFLNQIVNIYHTLDSQRILTRLRSMIIHALKQSVDDENSTRDGMDMSLIIYDKDKLEIQYSGAYNSIYIISSNKPEIVEGGNDIREFSHDNTVLYELKANRMPIGIFVLKSGEFTKKVVKVNLKDRIYMFSDGFPDLFSKHSKQKFTSKRFKELLLKNKDIQVSLQYNLLESTFVSWVGDDKQIDDILVMGFEI